MLIDAQWVLMSTGKWHAWPKGGRKTMCGRVNAEHLRDRPAVRIIKEPPAISEDRCASCAKAVLGPAALPADVSETAAAWVGHLRRHLTRARIKAADAVVQALAERLGEVGGPDDDAAREVFEQVKGLLLRPHFLRTRGAAGKERTISTLPHLKDALTKLPPNTGALQQVAVTLRLWRSITNRDPHADRFKADQVIDTILKLPPNPEAYIRRLSEKGLPHLAAMFHPNTLERAKHDTALRGLFAGSSAYWNDTSEALNIVTE